tara:strand:- start:716 stop:1066 length:351 start_codon:yes stop_codon:yes gene_type:complete
MKTIIKRFLLFLLLCIPIRLLLVYIAKTINNKHLPYLGWILLIPAIGFLYIYASNSRKTGLEVFGNKIWWNDLRPIHGMNYLIFSILAINKYKKSWIILLIDVLIGLLSFFIHHLQ